MLKKDYKAILNLFVTKFCEEFKVRYKFYQAWFTLSKIIRIMKLNYNRSKIIFKLFATKFFKDFKASYKFYQAAKSEVKFLYWELYFIFLGFCVSFSNIYLFFYSCYTGQNLALPAWIAPFIYILVSVAGLSKVSRQCKALNIAILQYDSRPISQTPFSYETFDNVKEVAKSVSEAAAKPMIQTLKPVVNAAAQDPAIGYWAAKYTAYKTGDTAGKALIVGLTVFQIGGLIVIGGGGCNYFYSEIFGVSPLKEFGLAVMKEQTYSQGYHHSTNFADYVGVAKPFEGAEFRHIDDFIRIKTENPGISEEKAIEIWNKENDAKQAAKLEELKKKYAKYYNPGTKF
jgi:hypothetical protein